MNPATNALKEIQIADRLENRTKKALAPESKEDFALLGPSEGEGKC